MIEYNGSESDNNEIDRNSEISSECSDSSIENLPETARKEAKNNYIMNNAIVYRYLQEKETNFISKVFQGWRDYHVIELRSKIFEAETHYSQKLLDKSFEGLMDYVMKTGEFKEKLILFYYRYLMGRCFEHWKKGKEEHQGEEVEEGIGEESEQRDKGEERRGSPGQEVRKSFYEFTHISRSEKEFKFGDETVDEKRKYSGEKSLIGRLTEKENPRETRNSPKKQLINDYRPPRLSPHRPDLASKTRISQKANETMYERQGIHSSMINSRASARTYYQDLTQLESKSRRKFTPIREQIELPLPQKSVKNVESSLKNTIKNEQNINFSNNRFSEGNPQEKGNEYYLQKYKEESEMKLQAEKQKEEQKKMEELQKIKEKELEKTEKSKKIIELLKKLKTYELSVIEDMQKYNHNFAEKYQRISLVTLETLKLL